MISPYTKLSYKIDSLTSLADSVINTQQTQSAKLDSLSNFTQILASNDSANNNQINTLITQLQDISIYGTGLSDVISVISIPLILMLFAFALPFIFDIVNHINSKYESKVLSQLFESHRIYKQFWCVTYISLTYVFILGTIYLILPTTYQKFYSDIASWCSLFVALIYSLSVVLFIRYCVRFNKADNLVCLIEKAYQKDQNRPSIWKKLRHKIKQWRHRKDADWLKFNKQAIRLVGGWDKGSSEIIYNQRLVELCKYALREHDITLFYNVMEGFDKIVDKEKQSLYKSFGEINEELAEGAIHYNTKDFFKQIFVFYPTCQQDNNIEESLIWKLLYAYNKSRFINVVDILFLSQMLLILCDKNQQLILEKYIGRAGYYFSFIPNLPRIHYVKGLVSKKRPLAESKSRENWNNLCNFHFLVFSYAFSKGMYGLLDSLISNEIYHYNCLFPETASDVLIRYARCKRELKEFGNFGLWRIEEIFGKKVDVEECISQYAMILLLLSHKMEDRQPEEMTSEDLTILQSQKANLIAKAKRLQKDNMSVPFYERIKDADIDKLFTDTIQNLILSINPIIQDEENIQTDKEPTIIERIQSICPFKFFHKSMKTVNTNNNKNKQRNWRQEGIPVQQKETFENCFNGILHDIERQTPITYWDGGIKGKTSSIDINECALVIDKLFFIFADNYSLRGLYIDYLEVITNRLVYVLLSAYEKMNIKDTNITIADFSHFIDGFIKNRPDDYLIIDVDSHLNSWIDITYDAEYNKSYKGIPYHTIEGVGRFSFLTDLPVYDSFKNTILIIRKSDQPVIMNKKENNGIKFRYVDNSLEEGKRLSIRVGVDLGKEVAFNPKSTIVRIKIKKMIV